MGKADTIPKSPFSNHRSWGRKDRLCFWGDNSTMRRGTDTRDDLGKSEWFFSHLHRAREPQLTRMRQDSTSIYERLFFSVYLFSSSQYVIRIPSISVDFPSEPSLFHPPYHACCIQPVSLAREPLIYQPSPCPAPSPCGIHVFFLSFFRSSSKLTNP